MPEFPFCHDLDHCRPLSGFNTTTVTQKEGAGGVGEVTRMRTRGTTPRGFRRGKGPENTSSLSMSTGMTKHAMSPPSPCVLKMVSSSSREAAIWAGTMRFPTQKNRETRFRPRTASPGEPTHRKPYVYIFHRYGLHTYVDSRPLTLGRASWWP